MHSFQRNVITQNRFDRDHPLALKLRERRSLVIWKVENSEKRLNSRNQFNRETGSIVYFRWKAVDIDIEIHHLKSFSLLDVKGAELYKFDPKPGWF